MLALSGCTGVGHLLHTDELGATRPSTAAADHYAQAPRQTAVEATETQDEAVTHTDVFDRIRAGSQLGASTRPEVESEIAWFVRNQDFLDRTFARARPYLFHIVEELERHGLPVDLALLPVVESAFQPTAYSPGKAAGLWQFIPGTGRRYGLKQTRWYDGRRDVAASTRAAIEYLTDLREHFDGNWLHALAAYNCGEALVARRIAANRKAGKPTDFWSLDLPRETSGYVPRMLAIAMIVNDPARYRVRLASIPNEPYWQPVQLSRQVDLAATAKAIGLPLEEMKTLNPGFLRNVTDPKGPHTLLVPVQKAPMLAQMVDTLPAPTAAAIAVAQAEEDAPAEGRRHTVRRGENLGLIAARYKVSVAALQRANGLEGTFIRTGQRLTIPGRKGEGKATAVRAESRKSDKGESGHVEQTTHTVRNGDNPWDIARKYGVRLEDLLAWNGLKRNARLKVNQKLVLMRPAQAQAQSDSAATPAKAKVAAEGKATLAAASPAGAQSTEAVTYEVRNGDSFWTIARSFNVRVKQLLEWNKLPKSAKLKPGQRLIVYPEPADRG